ncbi:MAG: ParA family partition ATPase [Pseudomonadota bacterium]
MAAKVITVAQQKGGAGKTTLVAHLAVALAQTGKSVAVVDIDPQGSLSRWAQVRQESGANDPELTVSQIQGWRTTGEVEKLSRAHDIVLVDSPPHMETESRIAVRTADLVVVPIQPSPMDVWASEATVTMADSEGTSCLLVLNRVPPRGKLVDELRPEVKKLGAKLARTSLGNRIALASSMMKGRGVTEGPKSRAAEEITALAREVSRLA